jgi:hypothetical protein
MTHCRHATMSANSAALNIFIALNLCAVVWALMIVIMGYVIPQPIMPINYVAALHINITNHHPQQHWQSTQTLFHLECIVYFSVKKNITNYKVENKLF